MKHLNAARESLFRKVGSFEQSENDKEVEVALQWNTGFHESIHSFANGISTTEGGMHEEGFKKALTNVVNRYARAKNTLKEKDENLLGEDIREGLTAIVSVRLRDPQFEGQTKAKLGNVADALAGRAGHQREAGRVAGGEPARGQPDRPEGPAGRPGPGGGPPGPRPHPPQVGPRRRRAAGQAGRLLVADPRECELFIVEGNSAGGSAKDARDPRTQAILPIRGKILNVERARIDKMLKNERDPGADRGDRGRAGRGLRRRPRSATTR